MPLDPNALRERAIELLGTRSKAVSDYRAAVRRDDAALKAWEKETAGGFRSGYHAANAGRPAYDAAYAEHQNARQSLYAAERAVLQAADRRTSGAFADAFARWNRGEGMEPMGAKLFSQRERGLKESIARAQRNNATMDVTDYKERLDKLRSDYRREAVQTEARTAAAKALLSLPKDAYGKSKSNYHFDYAKPIAEQIADSANKKHGKQYDGAYEAAYQAAYGMLMNGRSAQQRSAESAGGKPASRTRSSRTKKQSA